MKKIFLALLLAISLAVPGTVAAKKAPMQDTTYTGGDPYFKSNIEQLVRVQEENRSKQKRQAMIRIAFGVAMLVVLVIGISRRRKR